MAKRNKTSSEIGNIFSVDESTIRRWVTLGCPCDKGGRGVGSKFSASEVAAWMKSSNVTGKTGRPQTKESADLAAAKLRKENALVAKYERENAVASGQLIDAAIEQARDVGNITTLRNRLCGMGAMLSPQMDGLDGAERQRLIDEAVESFLIEFSK